MSAHDLTVTQVAAGLGHCLAVASSGEVFAFGWNSAGQLGLGDSQRAQETIAMPSPIFGIPAHPAAIIAAGRVHSLLITDDMLSDEVALLSEGDSNLQGVSSMDMPQPQRLQAPLFVLL